MREMGMLKQKILQINNQVNQGIFGSGLIWQKVDLFEDRIFILAKNKRVPALSSLEDKENFTSKLMDIALINQFKRNFKDRFHEEFTDYKILTMLKDYDPIQELSGTIIMVDRPFNKG